VLFAHHLEEDASEVHCKYIQAVTVTDMMGANIHTHTNPTLTFWSIHT